MNTETASPATAALTKFPAFRLKVILNTVLVVVIGLIVQQYLMDFADGMAYRTFYFQGFLTGFGNLLIFAIIPPAIVGTLLIFFYVGPLHRVVWTVFSGKRPAERARKTALRILVLYPYVLLVLNVVGFAVGYLLGTPPQQLATQQGIVLLIQNVAGGAVFAFVQISLNNLVLARPRMLLRVHVLGDMREPSASQRNMLIIVSLALYVMMTAIGVSQSITNATLLYSDVYESVVKEGKSIDDAQAEYKAAVAKIRNVPVEKVVFPADDTAARTVNPVFVYFAIFVFLIALAVFIQLMTSRSQREQFGTLTSKLREITEGKADLTQQVTIAQFDELGVLTEAINQFMRKLRELFGKFVEAGALVTHSSATLRGVLGNAAAATEQMVASISQISSNAASQANVVKRSELALSTMLNSLDRISTNVDTQASYVEETSSAINQMAANIRSVSESTSKANTVAAGLGEVAKEGSLAVGNAAKAVRDLEESSEKVNAIVGVISKIAAQTNLLAMNAAIEAAHAGDAGRGFAVVAEEVRNLAENSAASAKEITSHIKGMATLIGAGVRLSEDAGHSLDRIREDINNTTTLVNGIASAMQEQAAGANEIVSAMGALVGATQDIRKIAEEQKSNNAVMRSSIEALVHIFTEIQEATEEQAKGNREIIDGIMNLQNVAGDNQEIIDRLQLLLQGFVLHADNEEEYSETVPEGT